MSFHSHERTQHSQVNNGDVTVEQDEFGYFLCRYRCGKTYKTIQGRNRYYTDNNLLAYIIIIAYKIENIYQI